MNTDHTLSTGDGDALPKKLYDAFLDLCLHVAQCSNSNRSKTGLADPELEEDREHLDSLEVWLREASYCFALFGWDPVMEISERLMRS
jgi:hypothetical protein